MDFDDWFSGYYLPDIPVDYLRDYIYDRMKEAYDGGYEFGKDSRDEEVQDSYEDGYNQGKSDIENELEVLYEEKIKMAFMQGLTMTKEHVI